MSEEDGSIDPVEQKLRPLNGDGYVALDRVEGGGAGCKEYFIFSLVCLVTTLASGGLIIGVGPFIEKMVHDGYFSDRCDDGDDGCAAQYNAMNPIFNGGFQIMTWGSCLAGLLVNIWGPRINATLGLSILTTGCRILSTATTADGPYLWMLGYGFVGAGGNLMYISSFHFANLFQKRAVPIGVLGGIFNLSGLVFMVLNSKSFTVHSFFEMYFYIGLALTILVLIIYPDVQFTEGDSYKPTLPGISHVQCTTQDLCRPEIKSAVFSERFIGFCALFAWCTMVNVVVGGLVTNLIASKTNDNHMISIFNGYVYPAVGNSTFLFTPFVGYLIQKVGFALPMFLCVLCTQMCLVMCWAPTLNSQYLMLIFFNLMQAFAYTLEFAYIQLTYPESFYGPLIAFVIAFQGTVGFIAWPGLSPNPFGETAFTPVLLLCLVPSFALYYVPFRQRHYDVVSMGNK